jgi:hypothetical protein
MATPMKGEIRSHMMDAAEDPGARRYFAAGLAILEK